MTDPLTRERCPAEAPNPTDTRTVIVSADEDRTQARCERCGHPLHAPRSVSRGIGPVCAALVDLDELPEAVGHDAPIV